MNYDQLPALFAAVMTEPLSDVDDIRALCDERHPHSSDELLPWLAVHRLLRHIDAAGPRCSHCEHSQDEHLTPGGECVHGFCSCDQSFELVRAALADG